MSDSRVDLSIIITAHEEGIVIHKTLLSIQQALLQLEPRLNSEVILHLDCPNKQTLEYVDCNRQGVLSNVKILQNTFLDLALSRNTAIAEAEGVAVALVNAGDLLTSSFLAGARRVLAEQANTPEKVLHPEYTLHFGTMEWLDKPVPAYSNEEMSRLLTYSNYGSSSIIARRALFLQHPYPVSAGDYSNYDWWFNVAVLASGAEHATIEKSVVFEREGARAQKKAFSQVRDGILPASYTFANTTEESKASEEPIKAEEATEAQEPAAAESLEPQAPEVSTIRKLKDSVRNTFPEFYSGLYRRRNTARLIKEHAITRALPYWAALNTDNNLSPKKIKPKDIPEWLLQEWANIHFVDSAVVPQTQFSRDVYVRDMKEEEPLRAKVGEVYQNILGHLRHQNYDYAMIVPWFVVGGADKYSVEMINTLQACRPNLRILAISTLHAENTYARELSESIDFVDFGTLTASLTINTKLRLLEHLIENAGISTLQVLNSGLGYDYLERNSQYIEAKGIDIVITSFNRQIDSGFYVGFTVAEAPRVIERATLATSDNSETLRIWEEEYGACKDKLLLLRQQCEVKGAVTRTYSSGDRLKILWASRFDPQKIPEIVPEIAKLVSDFADIDMYGYYTTRPYKKLAQGLSGNVSYKGPFAHGLASLPIDEYDVYLYTSNSDGTPNAILESISLGLPTIAPAVGGIPDIIYNEETGILVQDYSNPKEYAAGIVKLRDSELQKKLAERALTLITEELSPQNYLKIIEEYAERLDL